MEPINYMQNLQPVDILGSLQSGLKLGQDIKAQQEQKANAEQYKTDLQDFMASPTPQKVIQMELKYPEQGKAIKSAYEQLDEPRKQSETQLLGQVYIPLQNGDTDTAISVLEGKKQAMANSGQDTTQMDAMINMVKTNPQAAKAWAGMGLVKTMGIDQFQKLSDTYIKAEEAPIKKQELQQNIISKQVDDESKKLNDKIKVVQTQLNKEGVGIRQQELKIKLQTLQDQKDKLSKKDVAEGQTSLDFTRSAKGILNDILSDPESLSAVTGASAFKGLVPGTTNRAMSGKIEQLRSMLAASNKDVLKGPTSDRDIVFLKSIAANLDQYQDEDEFKKVLGKIKVILDKNEKIITDRYGVKASTYMENAPKQDQQKTLLDADSIIGR